LAATIPGPLPATLITTVKNQTTISVNLANTGPAAVKGKYTVSFYASTDQALDPTTDTKISTLSASLPKLAIGGNKLVKFKLGTVPRVPTSGPYFILVDVSGAPTGGLDVIAASPGTVAITNPFVDLSDTVTITSPSSGTVVPGKSYALSVDVTNNGNTTAKGPLAIDVASSLSFVGTSPVDEGIITKTINIKPGATKIVKLTSKIPLGTSPGSYYYVTTLDPANTFNDPNLANNVAITTTALTVTSLYPSILGTFTGPALETAGPQKGDTGTVSVTITNESNSSGVFLGTGSTATTRKMAAFALNGTISTKGVVTGTAGKGASFTAKLVGNVLTGKITKAKEIVTFTATRP
jgi:hypothetical protein